MASTTSLDVKVWAVRSYKGARKTTHRVRWLVAGEPFQQTFASRKLADSFRAELLTAIRNGQPFQRGTGQPSNWDLAAREVSWVAHAMAFVDMKWPHASPRHRKGIAEGLVTATVAALPPESPHPASLRLALTHWAFNTSARKAAMDVVPGEYAEAMAWATRRSPTLTEVAQATRLRAVLDALTLKLDGKPASPSTVTRKRSALYSMFQYAVEIEALPQNPMDKVRPSKRLHSDVVDRRVVVNPEQARRLIAHVAEFYPTLEAFFGCIYFAAMRPAEVRHLNEADLDLPDDAAGWGTLRLLGSTQTSGSAWTDSGSATEDRALKHRASRATREVPAPPELVDALRRHMTQFPPGVGGRLFVNRTGRAGAPVSPPFSTPQSMGVVYRVWDLARRAALTEAEYGSPLARRPYDLRHAAVSLWLNAGVAPTQVAEWAGHSVNVLLRVYAKCIVGQDEASRARVQSALTPTDPASSANPTGDET